MCQIEQLFYLSKNFLKFMNEPIEITDCIFQKFMHKKKKSLIFYMFTQHKRIFHIEIPVSF